MTLQSKPSWPEQPGACKSEHLGKAWLQTFSGSKLAMKNGRTGEVCIPSKAYISRHQPRGPWGS